MSGNAPTGLQTQQWGWGYQILHYIEQSQVWSQASEPLVRRTTLPLYSCPSIGDPIPITDQLTNPEKTAGRNSSSTAIGQMEPTGVFTGDSAGTNVICLGAGGEPYKLYWEGFVMASSVELIWDGSAMVPKPGGGVSEHKFTGKK